MSAAGASARLRSRRGCCKSGYNRVRSPAAVVGGSESAVRYPRASSPPPDRRPHATSALLPHFFTRLRARGTGLRAAFSYSCLHKAARDLPAIWVARRRVGNRIEFRTLAQGAGRSRGRLPAHVPGMEPLRAPRLATNPAPTPITSSPASHGPVPAGLAPQSLRYSLGTIREVRSELSAMGPPGFEPGTYGL